MRKLATITLFISLAFCPNSKVANAQCTGVCGDISGDGEVELVDAAIFRNYYLDLDWGVSDSACADVDGYLGISVRDFSWVWAEVFFGAIPMICPPDSGTFVPVPNTNNYLHYNCIIPPGDTSVVVYVSVTVTGNNLAVGLGYSLEVDGQPTTLESIALATPPYWDFINAWDPQSYTIPPGYLFARMFDFDPTHGSPPGTYDMCTVTVSVPVSTDYQVITLEPAEWPPGDNTPMVVERYNHNGWALNLDPIVVALTGDANNDRVLNSADVIELVNFVFKSGPVPYPVPAAGDVNCSGSVTSSDIIELVNHVFKSGPGPCDVAVECTINLDQWTCP